MSDWRAACSCGHKFNVSRLPSPPNQSGFVNDYEAIAGESAGRMIQLAMDLEKRTGTEMVAVIIGTTKPLIPENYAFYLFNKWRLGKRSGNAVLLLVSMHERRVEIEISRALEDKLKMSAIESILDDTIIPYFKRSKYGEGLLEGMKKLVSEIEKISA